MEKRLKHLRHTPGSPDGGFTLIEVLIALLVLSIGLLGLAALQVTGLRETQMARMRTQAVLLTYDMADRMRANTNQAANYVYDSADYPSGLPGGVAGADLTDWITNELQLLPDSSAEITNPAGSDYQITVRWNETRDPAVTGTDCPNNSADDLPCYQLDLTL